MTERVRQPGHSPSRNVANVTTVHKLGLGGSPGITFGKAVVAMSPGTPPKPLHPSDERTLEIVAATSAQSDRLSNQQPRTTHLPRKTAHSHGACSAILGVAVGDLGPSGRLL